MGEHSHPNSDSVIAANHDMLATITGSTKRTLEDFLPCSQQNKRSNLRVSLAESESVISVFESRTYHLHTTHSWNFLGFDSINQHNELKIQPKADVIVGVIDT
ncbi:subtilisin-like protease SBT5.3, partial [Thalictrum thalictroides]